MIFDLIKVTKQRLHQWFLPFNYRNISVYHLLFNMDIFDVWEYLLGLSHDPNERAHPPVDSCVYLFLLIVQWFDNCFPLLIWNKSINIFWMLTHLHHLNISLPFFGHWFFSTWFNLLSRKIIFSLNTFVRILSLDRWSYLIYISNNLVRDDHVLVIPTNSIDVSFFLYSIGTNRLSYADDSIRLSYSAVYVIDTMLSQWCMIRIKTQRTTYFLLFNDYLTTKSFLFLFFQNKLKRGL